MSRIQCFLVQAIEDGFRNVETGETYQRPLPPGAMWFANADWAQNTGIIGTAGRCLVVQTPGGVLIWASRHN